VIGALATVAAAPAAGLLLALHETRRSRGLAPGDAFPPGVLMDTGGRRVDLRTWRGTPHLVLLFQSRCPACRDEIRTLASLAAPRAAASRVRLLCLDSSGEARSFARAVPTPFPVLTDPSGAIVRRARKLVVPTLYRLDAAGLVDLVRAGAVGHAELVRLLDSVSAGSAGAQAAAETR
jgi:peroxiredoxin